MISHFFLKEKDFNGNRLNCDCVNFHKDCLSVSLSNDEKILKGNCMKLTRSVSSFPFFNCSFGYREQINQHSAYIDATQIYGNSEKRAKALRLGQRGLFIFLRKAYQMFFTN